MAFKVVLFCASALLVQSISGQFLLGCGPPVYDFGCGCDTSYGFGTCGYNTYGCGCSGNLNVNQNYATFTDGGNLIVKSYSPIPPSGVTVTTELALNGNLDICGTMPFLSAVQFQTELPSCGSGCVDYSCGSGCDISVNGGSLNTLVGLNSLSGCGCNCYY